MSSEGLDGHHRLGPVSDAKFAPVASWASSTWAMATTSRLPTHRPHSSHSHVTKPGTRGVAFHLSCHAIFVYPLRDCWSKSSLCRVVGQQLSGFIWPS